MTRLAANLSTLFTDLPFPDRYAAAAAAGFRAVECQFPYGVPAEVFETMAAENNLAFDWDGYRKAMDCLRPGDVAILGTNNVPQPNQRAALASHRSDLVAAMESMRQFKK